MDFFNFTDVSFNSKESVGQLCEDLNNIIGQDIWYDKFHVRNTKSLRFLHDIITDMNNDKVMCGCFGLYPSYVAGILDTVKGIHFYILCEEKLNYAKYITTCLARKNYSVKLLSKIHLTCVWEEHFQSTLDGEKVTISFEARQFPNLPSDLIFAESVLAKIQLSFMAYGIVNFNKHVTYISNEVLTLRRDCVFERYTCELDLPKKLAGCRLYTLYCSMYPKKTSPCYILYCTKQYHRLFGKTQCRCKLCIKERPASLKSQCIDRLHRFF